MANMKFEKLECSAIVVCVSKNDEISNLDAIKSELQDGFYTILEELMDSRNAVVDFELSDVVLLADGSDKKDLK